MTLAWKQLINFSRNKRFSGHCIRPERYQDLANLPFPIITHGYGSSYGDSALGAEGHVLLMQRLNRFLSFDVESGIITAEAGLSITELLSVIVPAGWFLPVTPGTQKISLGGCIAADAHGKNHRVQGCFSEHVLSFDLLTANKTWLHCSREENASIFYATLGGLGLTGIIGTVTLQLRSITSPYLDIQQNSFKSLSDIIVHLTEKAASYEYAVAWVDALGKQGRGIVSYGEHMAEIKGLKPAPFSKKNLPAIPGLLNPITLRAYNALHYYRESGHKSFFCHYEPYLYPLDHFSTWNKLYGKRGFCQFQCIIPLGENINTEAATLLAMIKKHGCYPYLTVLKIMHKPSEALLSFAQPGLNLAIDIPCNEKLPALMKELHAFIISLGGKINIIKDSYLNRQEVEQMYPRFSEWLSIKKEVDPDNLIYSALSQRLELG